MQSLPEWAEETYPLYAYHHAGPLMSAKVRAFLDFVVALTREPPLTLARASSAEPTPAPDKLRARRRTAV